MTCFTADLYEYCAVSWRAGIRWLGRRPKPYRYHQAHERSKSGIGKEGKAELI